DRLHLGKGPERRADLPRDAGSFGRRDRLRKRRADPEGTFVELRQKLRTEQRGDRAAEGEKDDGGGEDRLAALEDEPERGLVEPRERPHDDGFGVMMGFAPGGGRGRRRLGPVPLYGVAREDGHDSEREDRAAQKREGERQRHR